MATTDEADANAYWQRGQAASTKKLVDDVTAWSISDHQGTARSFHDVHISHAACSINAPTRTPPLTFRPDVDVVDMVDVSDQPSTAEGQVVRRRTIITLGGVGVSSGVEAPSSPADAGVDAGKLPSLPRFVNAVSVQRHDSRDSNSETVSPIVDVRQRSEVREKDLHVRAAGSDSSGGFDHKVQVRILTRAPLNVWKECDKTASLHSANCAVDSKNAAQQSLPLWLRELKEMRGEREKRWNDEALERSSPPASSDEDSDEDSDEEDQLPMELTSLTLPRISEFRPDRCNKHFPLSGPTKLVKIVEESPPTSLDLNCEEATPREKWRPPSLLSSSLLSKTPTEGKSVAPPTLLSPAIVNEIVNFDASVERKIDIEEGDSVPTPPKGILKKQSAARLGQLTAPMYEKSSPPVQAADVVERATTPEEQAPMIDETVVSGHHRDLGYYSLERGGNLKEGTNGVRKNIAAWEAPAAGRWSDESRRSTSVPPTGKTGPSTQLTRGMAKDKAVQLVREYFSKATPPALAAKPVAVVVQEERRYDLALGSTEDLDGNSARSSVDLNSTGDFDELLRLCDDDEVGDFDSDLDTFLASATSYDDDDEVGLITAPSSTTVRAKRSTVSRIPKLKAFRCRSSASILATSSPVSSHWNLPSIVQTRCKSVDPPAFQSTKSRIPMWIRSNSGSLDPPPASRLPTRSKSRAKIEFSSAGRCSAGDSLKSNNYF